MCSEGVDIILFDILGYVDFVCEICGVVWVVDVVLVVVSVVSGVEVGIEWVWVIVDCFGMLCLIVLNKMDCDCVDFYIMFVDVWVSLKGLVVVIFLFIG